MTQIQRRIWVLFSSLSKAGSRMDRISLPFYMLGQVFTLCLASKSKNKTFSPEGLLPWSEKSQFLHPSFILTAFASFTPSPLLVFHAPEDHGHLTVSLHPLTCLICLFVHKLWRISGPDYFWTLCRRMFFWSLGEVLLLIELQAKVHHEVWQWTEFWEQAIVNAAARAGITTTTGCLHDECVFHQVSFRMSQSRVWTNRMLQGLLRGKSVYDGHSHFPFQNHQWVIGSTAHIHLLFVCGYRCQGVIPALQEFRVYS